MTPAHSPNAMLGKTVSEPPIANLRMLRRKLARERCIRNTVLDFKETSYRENIFGHPN